MINSLYPGYVKDLRIYIQDYLDDLPDSPKGHKMFTYDEAVGLQVLQQELREAITLEVIIGGKAKEPKSPIQVILDELEDQNEAVAQRYYQ